jgi:hypothetical protein
MAIWYPGSGLTYNQYLQANSFFRDISGKVEVSKDTNKAKLNEQTKELIASNEQLSSNIELGFHSVSNTLTWGFNLIERGLNNIDSSIVSLQADFNYNMGLLIEQVQINNKILLTLIDKIDGISKILEKPTLTQAREFYHIGCDRLAKGLLDKALEAFLEAEKKNDADFFTQFAIGKLYLYGIDEDDNVFDSEKAKKHLLDAARYAKAETSVDPSFSRFAAEALFHASIAVYTQTGDEVARNNKNVEIKLLNEARALSSEALEIYPQLTECIYHLAKYAALLNDSKYSIQSLEKAIVADRKYAIKVDIDHAFDPIRKKVFDLLFRLKNEKAGEAERKIEDTKILLTKIELWHSEESIETNNLFQKCNQNVSKATNDFQTQTYFGYIDAIRHCISTIEISNEIKNLRIAQLVDEIKKNMKTAKNNLSTQMKSNKEIEVLFGEINELKNNIREDIERSAKLKKEKSDQLADESFNKILLQLQVALQKSFSVKELVVKEKELADKENKEKQLQKWKDEASLKFAKSLSLVGSIIIGIIGANSCVTKSLELNSLTDLITNFTLVSGAILGALIGALIGYVIGQFKE